MMSAFKKKLFSWSAVAGLLFIALGIKILVTGELRSVIVLGDSKYLVGGISIATGVYFLSVLFRDNGRH